MTMVDDVQVKDGVDQDTVDAVKSLSGTYKYGWDTEIEMEYAPKGVDADIVRLISGKNDEPEWMTQWRLEAFERWQKIEEPDWAMVDYLPPPFKSAGTSTPFLTTKAPMPFGPPILWAEIKAISAPDQLNAKGALPNSCAASTISANGLLPLVSMMPVSDPAAG